MDQQGYIINFNGVSDAEANIYAEELRNVLLDASSDIEVERRRSDPFTQDFGATLVLVLGTPAIVTITKALGDWLTRCSSAEITIKTDNGEIIGKNIKSKDIIRITELLLENHKKQ